MLRLNLRQYPPRSNHQGLHPTSTFYFPLMVSSRVKKRKRAEPIPRNAFPHVVEKVNEVIQEKNKNINLLLGSCCRFRGQGVVQHVN